MTAIDSIEKITTTIVNKDFELGTDVLISFKDDILKAKHKIDQIILSNTLANLEWKNEIPHTTLDPNFQKFTTAAFERKYPDAKNYLLSLLRKKESDCREVIAILNASNDQKTIAYIAKRFMAVFAYEEKYSQVDANGQEKSIGTIVKVRSNMSASLK